MTTMQPAKPAKKHCLIVDDSDVIRKVAAHLLKNLNFETSQAENGQIALEQCLKAMPDAVLLDWQMPVMGGIDFLASLRAQPNGDQPVVVYCTTENDPADIARAIAAGADEYLLKPFDRDSLRGKFADMGLV
jgi:two-component system, chemotaxis family, chemotaxis protein CheY